MNRFRDLRRRWFSRRCRIGRCRRLRRLCCMEPSSDGSEPCSKSDSGDLSRTLSDVTLSEVGDENEDLTIAPRLREGLNFHVQFICVDSDLHIAEKARRYVSQNGFKCVIYSEDATCGKMDVVQIQDFTMKSLWNVIVVSPKSFNDKLFDFQSQLAVSIAVNNRKASVIVLHARKNMENFLPSMFLPFRHIHNDHDEFVSCLQNLTRLMSTAPPTLVKYRNPAIRQRLRDTRLSLSDETLRVKNASEAERSECHALRDGVRLQGMKKMRQNIKTVHEKIQGYTSPLQKRKKAVAQ